MRPRGRPRHNSAVAARNRASCSELRRCPAHPPMRNASPRPPAAAPAARKSFRSGANSSRSTPARFSPVLTITCTLARWPRLWAIRAKSCAAAGDESVSTQPCRTAASSRARWLPRYAFSTGRSTMHRQIASRERRRLVDIRHRQRIHHRRLGIAAGKIAKRIDDDVGIVSIRIGLDDRADFHGFADGAADEGNIMKDGRAGDDTSRLAEGMLRVHAKNQKKESPDPSGSVGEYSRKWQ
jgi:hypothetical protein